MIRVTLLWLFCYSSAAEQIKHTRRLEKKIDGEKYREKEKKKLEGCL